MTEDEYRGCIIKLINRLKSKRSLRKAYYWIDRIFVNEDEKEGEAS